MVLVATDLNRILAFELGLGKPSREKIAAIMDERIEPYCKLFCDKYNSFNQLSQEQNLKVFSYNRNYLKMLDDNLNPI